MACGLFTGTQLQLEDALFLTKNTIKELQTSYICRSRRVNCPLDGPELPQNGDAASREFIRPSSPSFLGRDFDLSLSNVVNSVFPIDLIVSYNATSTSSSEFVARYASFSLVLNGEVSAPFAVVPGGACSQIDEADRASYTGKVLIAQRGNCSFERKVSCLIESKLEPAAIIIADNNPHGALITMYSSTFNKDGEIRIPILFMGYDDFQLLDSLHKPGVVLTVRTATIDSFVGLVLLMAVSPPLMILLCYLLIRGLQLWGRRRRNRSNQRYVRLLPVYIYNGNHLAPATKFYEYLTATSQANDITLVLSSSDDLSAGQDSEVTVGPSYSFVVNGTDLYSLKHLKLLFAPTDYYPTQKCSICLGRFHTLKSRVLVLDCKHMYHEKCLSNWLINFKKSCPLCNELLTMPDEFSLLGSGRQSYGTFDNDLERGEQLTDGAALRFMATAESRSTLSQPGRHNSGAQDHTIAGSAHTQASLYRTAQSASSSYLSFDASVESASHARSPSVETSSLFVTSTSQPSGSLRVFVEADSSSSKSTLRV